MHYACLIYIPSNEHHLFQGLAFYKWMTDVSVPMDKYMTYCFCTASCVLVIKMYIKIYHYNTEWRVILVSMPNPVSGLPPGVSTSSRVLPGSEGSEDAEVVDTVELLHSLMLRSTLRRYWPAVSCSSLLCIYRFSRANCSFRKDFLHSCSSSP